MPGMTQDLVSVLAHKSEKNIPGPEAAAQAAPTHSDHEGILGAVHTAQASALATHSLACAGCLPGAGRPG